jgi:hypothetical protein
MILKVQLILREASPQPIKPPVTGRPQTVKPQPIKRPEEQPLAAHKHKEMQINLCLANAGAWALLEVGKRPEQPEDLLGKRELRRRRAIKQAHKQVAERFTGTSLSRAIVLQIWEI